MKSNYFVTKFYKSQVVYKALSPVGFISLATEVHPSAEFISLNWWNLPTELFPPTKSFSSRSRRSPTEKWNPQQNYLNSLSPAEIKESLSSLTNSSLRFNFSVLFNSSQGFYILRNSITYSYIIACAYKYIYHNLIYFDSIKQFIHHDIAWNWLYLPG